MLKEAHDAGARAALERLKIAEGWLSGMGRNLFGSPGRVFTEGTSAFRPGGFLSTKNVFWPAVSGPGGSRLNWINRASTLAAGAGLASQLMHPDPNEGHLAGTLGAAGGLVGSMYGFPALGALGAPILGRAGAAVGRGIGHALGSHPKERYL
ncbi:MAG TPA: hypothetical protein VIV09_00995 [Pseudolabrys sp.]